MSSATLIASGVLALVGLAIVLWANLVPAERLAARTAKRVGLALPAEPLRDRIVRRTRSTRRWIANCGALGLLLTLGGVLLGVTAGWIPDPEVALSWLALGGIVLGTAAGALLGVLTDRPQLDREQPRVAHAQHTSLRDYLDPIELVGARIVVALGVVAGLTAAFTPGAAATSMGVTAIVLAAVGMLSLVVLELGGRRIVLARPRPAASAEALVWDDARRGDDLRTLVTAPLMTGLYAFVIGLPALSTAIPRTGVDQTVALVLVNVGFYVLVLGLLAVLALALARQPARFYLRRLWPEVAAQAATEAQAAPNTSHAEEAEVRDRRAERKSGQTTR